VPFLTVGLSRLWVRLITGAPLDLVGPLVESLEHEMVAGDRRLQAMAGLPGLGARAALELALAPAPSASLPRAPIAFRPSSPRAARRVRSVQHMRLPPGRDAAWAAEEYVRWLPSFFRGLLRVDVDAGRVRRFRFVGVGVLLELTPAPARSTPDLQLFYVTGGRSRGRRSAPASSCARCSTGPCCSRPSMTSSRGCRGPSTPSRRRPSTST